MTVHRQLNQAFHLLSAQKINYRVT